MMLKREAHSWMGVRGGGWGAVEQGTGVAVSRQMHCS